MSRRLLPCVVVVLLLAGCTTSTRTVHAATPAPAPAPRTLVAFDSCDQLADELRAAAQQSVGPYGLPGDQAVSTAVGAGERTTMTAPEPATPAYSGTNTHEPDVDEPDIVKSDGHRIVTVEDGVLRVVDAATRRVTGRLDLGQGGPARLLLAGDRALVLRTAGTFPILSRRIRPIGLQPELLLVDLAGPPRLISRYLGTGRLVDARQTGSIARVVLGNAPHIVFPYRATSTDGMLQENRATIATAPADAWLPSWAVTTGTTTTRGRLGCGSVSRPVGYSGAALLSVLTFDLGAPALGDGDPVGVVADGDTVYATPTSIYVANDPSWRRTPGNPEQLTPPRDTEIFRFAISGSAKPAFAASGTVPGTIVNQYAMSEWDGHLRVATTDPAVNSSAVRVLTESGGKLVQVGSVDGLGKGERIYSVRFLGPRGYVVTFRQTDPLYCLDLSDPARPRVTGSLKITGYSSHLQPVSTDQLIGIGQDASEQGRQLGTQIALFDVADPAGPRLVARQQYPGGRSDAESDPHALLWWPASRLLVVPMADATSPTALALRVDAGGLRTLARTFPPAAGAEPPGPVRRALVIGDTLWTMTDSGLLASSLSTLDMIAWVPLQ